jgi:hypothetical protein
MNVRREIIVDLRIRSSSRDPVHATAFRGGCQWPQILGVASAHTIHSGQQGIFPPSHGYR